jgi:hypothetical protein
MESRRSRQALLWIDNGPHPPSPRCCSHPYYVCALKIIPGLTLHIFPCGGVGVWTCRRTDTTDTTDIPLCFQWIPLSITNTSTPYYVQLRRLRVAFSRICSATSRSLTQRTSSVIAGTSCCLCVHSSMIRTLEVVFGVVSILLSAMCYNL